ncbi:MAG: glycerol-3-phosphate 1-O-acyltransferase PlsY [Eubacterium sp.]|uniref:glycerol-3-phosphate 1-O-acyltransferase PlsY n=1 Tax=Eubacterium sp. TaxID=142586 RepID=UPI003A320527
MTVIATVIKFALVVLVSYLLGSLNFSIIFSKGVVKKDIRESGSGNAGATNMLRTYGKKFALLTMLGDIIKVAIAIIIAFLIFGSPVKYLFASPTDPTELQQIMFYKQFAGFFCVVGHIFPVFFKFKGGKGVAACTGMVIMVDWRIALILFVIFVIIVAISKWISLGSITIAILYPVLLYVFYKNIIVTLIALIFAVMVVVAHRQNIKRILNKTENKISFKKKK